MNVGPRNVSIVAKANKLYGCVRYRTAPNMHKALTATQTAKQPLIFLEKEIRFVEGTREQELKKEEEDCKTEGRLDMPEVKREEVMPEVKREEVMPEVKREEVMPEVKREEVMPEVKREEVMPEVKREEVRAAGQAQAAPAAGGGLFGAQGADGQQGQAQAAPVAGAGLFAAAGQPAAQPRAAKTAPATGAGGASLFGTQAAPQPGALTAQTQGANQPAVGGAPGLFGTQQADPPVWAHNSHPHYQNEHQLRVDTTRYTTRPDNTRIDSLNFGKSSHQATYNAPQVERNSALLDRSRQDPQGACVHGLTCSPGGSLPPRQSTLPPLSLRAGATANHTHTYTVSNRRHLPENTYTDLPKVFRDRPPGYTGHVKGCHLHPHSHASAPSVGTGVDLEAQDSDDDFLNGETAAHQKRRRTDAVEAHVQQVLVEEGGWEFSLKKRGVGVLVEEGGWKFSLKKGWVGVLVEEGERGRGGSHR
uniref:Uncharacterized protein n=1 Tax=Chromera velia CCMP2878 TaxID=1169474 RepID=A0A0G4F633_9ALVE|eukprot:Cvel_15299.t1-p1 / transcript=Cvel_15299.t1 / gene=Cvel_15299 / organism=Chromera_velia_CCMP2878 / gene_product=Probable serine/threonine-protein kinase kinX, putative / transcript_product=Probable serine/threonine-protein kinase kinX, putative / location=Cvel_scaffold1123:19371-23154(+) / protein_length=475 / sequence_SO=supercontig / SO=protein_coding / is_pseudo=false